MLQRFWPASAPLTLRKHFNPAQLCATLHLLTVLLDQHMLLTRQLDFPDGMTESTARFRFDGHQLYVAQLLHATSLHNRHIVAGTPIASGFAMSIVKATSAAFVLRSADAFGAAVRALEAAETRGGTCLRCHIGCIAYGSGISITDQIFSPVLPSERSFLLL